MSIALAVLAHTLLAIGLVLMKKGIGWIGGRRPRDAAWRKDLATWIAGFIFSNSYIVPLTMSLKGLPPHVVAAFAGWGVLVMIVLSRLWLGERFRPSDPAYSAALVFAIAILSLSQRPAVPRPADPSWLAGVAAFPFLFLPGALSRIIARRGRAFLLALVSGISAGLVVVFMKVLVQAYGVNVGSYFGSLYLYLYFVFSILSFLALQLAYKLDSILITGPVQYAASIIYPALCSALVFGNKIRLVQVAAILAVALAVGGILANRGAANTSPRAAVAS